MSTIKQMIKDYIEWVKENPITFIVALAAGYIVGGWVL